MKAIPHFLALSAVSLTAVIADTGLTSPIVDPDLVLLEKDGILTFEAEHFAQQQHMETRAWYRTTEEQTPEVDPDGDPPHLEGTSGGAYVELLPDTRRSHDDKLVRGENFSNEPGKMAILSYKVHIDNPGRYRVWARVYSSNTEDNGFHIGLDGQWPASGQRWQTVVKNRWHWESKQRTEEVHVGVSGKLWLDIDTAGEHTVEISMREDGIELDKLVLAKDFDYTPEGLGPEPQVKRGALPETYTVAKSGDDSSDNRFPKHWGSPPEIQTRDYVPLPGGYGHGSSSLKHWIQENLDRDAAAQSGTPTGAEREPAPAEDGAPDCDGSSPSQVNSSNGTRSPGHPHS